MNSSPASARVPRRDQTDAPPPTPPFRPDTAEAAVLDRERFMREIRTMAGLELPGIPAVYDIGIDEAHARSTARSTRSARDWCTCLSVRGDQRLRVQPGIRTCSIRAFAGIGERRCVYPIPGPRRSGLGGFWYAVRGHRGAVRSRRRGDEWWRSVQTVWLLIGADATVAELGVSATG
jgi:hypothetical protein